MSSDNRQKLLIDKRVQGALIRQIVLHWVAFVVATSLALCMLTWISNPFLSRGDLFVHVAKRLIPIIIAAACIVPLFVRDTLVFSHRMVGPIARLRRELKNLAEGKEVEKIEFRPGDFWQDVPAEFNEFSACVKNNA